MLNWQTVAYPHRGILLRNEKEQTIDTGNYLDVSQKHYSDWNKPVSKGYIQNDFRLEKKKNSIYRENIGVHQGFEVGIGSAYKLVAWRNL